MKCTYCGGTEFLEGPSGGMSVNVLCANPKCRHWFNHTPIMGKLEDLKRVEPTDDEKAQQRETANQLAFELRTKTWQEGVELHQLGNPAISCIRHTQNNQAGFYQAAGDDIVRLAGWLDAAHNKRQK